MCVAIPCQIIESSGFTAIGQARDGRRHIDMTLVGEQPVGTWVLCFLDAAREVVSAERASQIADALEALDRVANGGTSFDDLFADLIGREPQLPAHLQPGYQNGTAPSSADPVTSKMPSVAD